MTPDAPSLPPYSHPDFSGGEIVDVELVPSKRSPLRFGMRALLLFTGVCGVQFALMWYLGPLPGLLVSMGVCFTALTGLVFWAIIAIPARTSRATIAYADKAVIWLVLAIVALVVGTLAAGGGQLAYKEIMHQYRARTLEQELGFTYTTDQVWDFSRNNRMEEVVMVKSVTPGGVFDQAGIRESDAIVTNLTVREWFATLDENRGKQVDLTVATGVTPMTSLDKCPKRTVTVTIPSR